MLVRTIVGRDFLAPHFAVNRDRGRLFLPSEVGRVHDRNLVIEVHTLLLGASKFKSATVMPGRSGFGI